MKPPPDWMSRMPSNDQRLAGPRRPRNDYRWVCFWLGVLCGMVIYFMADKALGQQMITGSSAYAVDGDSLEMNGNRLRLWGIDAPELNQTCDGQPVGKMARTYLAGLLKSGPVICISKGTDRYGRILAVCRAGNVDINRTMVRSGMAFAYTRYTDTYTSEQGRGPVVEYHCANPETVRHAR
jgi:endonuclease YncB( thermonuclease family)